MNNKIQSNAIGNDLINKKMKKYANNQQYTQEIDNLISKPDFIEFAETLNELIEDGSTFNEILSSQLVLKKALAILRQVKNDSKKLRKKT
ncbi:MAG: hypothetical protein JXA54_01380 [Candidatus Heimdallarchaeota archaeon]|nr:hypothetical protein [Candidatus Heimdallarchaeota archaeon]